MWLFIRGLYVNKWCQLARDGWTPPFAGIFGVLHLCREDKTHRCLLLCFVSHIFYLSFKRYHFVFLVKKRIFIYPNTIDGERTKSLRNGCRRWQDSSMLLGFFCWRWPIHSFRVWAELEVRHIVCCVFLTAVLKTYKIAQNSWG